jgi:hypothetical protein
VLFPQPVAELIEHVFFEKQPPPTGLTPAPEWQRRDRCEKYQRRAIRIAVIFLTTGLALAIPNFGLACNLVGRYVLETFTCIDWEQEITCITPLLVGSLVPNRFPNHSNPRVSGLVL